LKGLEFAGGKFDQPIAHEDVLAEFGLTVADWKKVDREPMPEETPLPS
jgi:hypothetical protein